MSLDDVKQVFDPVLEDPVRLIGTLFASLLALVMLFGTAYGFNLSGKTLVFTCSQPVSLVLPWLSFNGQAEVTAVHCAIQTGATLAIIAWWAELLLIIFSAVVIGSYAFGL